MLASFFPSYVYGGTVSFWTPVLIWEPIAADFPSALGTPGSQQPRCSYQRIVTFVINSFSWRQSCYALYSDRVILIKISELKNMHTNDNFKSSYKFSNFWPTLKLLIRLQNSLNFSRQQMPGDMCWIWMLKIYRSSFHFWRPCYFIVQFSFPLELYAAINIELRT